MSEALEQRGFNLYLEYRSLEGLMECPIKLLSAEKKVILT